MNDDFETKNAESESELDPRLAAELGALALEIAPERDLLPGVRARIRARRAASRRRLLALAAGLALAVAGWQLLRAPRPAPPVPVVASAGEVVTVSAVRRTAFAEPDLALAGIREQLRREIEARQDRLPAATRALVFENLATIDRAIAEIERALAAEPGNSDLGRTYIEYREREIALLLQANRMAARL